MVRGVNYSVIRFRPDRVRDEYANIGIVSIDLENGDICFSMGSNLSEKINRFFPDYDNMLINNAIGIVIDDINRLKNMSVDSFSKKMVLAFDNAVRVREGVIFFSDKKSALTDNCLESYTDMLRDKYVD